MKQNYESITCSNDIFVFGLTPLFPHTHLSVSQFSNTSFNTLHNTTHQGARDIEIISHFYTVSSWSLIMHLKSYCVLPHTDNAHHRVTIFEHQTTLKCKNCVQHHRPLKMSNYLQYIRITCAWRRNNQMTCKIHGVDWWMAKSCSTIIQMNELPTTNLRNGNIFNIGWCYNYYKVTLCIEVLQAGL